MGIRGGLRRWYEVNARLFGRLHEYADVVSGLSLAAVIILALSVVQVDPNVSIPVVPAGNVAVAKALYVAVGVFVLSVMIQTVAGLRSFFTRVFARLLE